MPLPGAGNGGRGRGEPAGVNGGESGRDRQRGVLLEPPAGRWTTGPIRTRPPWTVRPARPTPLETEDVLRVRRAVSVALDRYPGPVGQLIAAELLDYADQAWRGEPEGLSERLVADLLGEAGPQR
ncbi:hypothetical protein LWC33_12405 [Pseudonocardia sp. RS11V-5]|uniref:hypothetical protein n=1 Tax=Pseudonocardia terrae TaxID=2905831 RepID=UPI001E5E01BE|nr:hypothetical protein [Pseudonocardia terrae]MCE3552257.1 hypothetical protein [Pseudonocardia terrae]